MSAAMQRITTPATDALSHMIKVACQEAVREGLNLSQPRDKRMLQVPAAAQYIGLSRREIYNMIENGELKSVKRGTRRLIDIGDLDAWIDTNKE